MGPKYIEIYDLVQASPDEYLMHHQIKGAKWGVHRGPPYPLQSGIRTKIKKVTKAAEKRVKENQAKRAARTAAKKEAASVVKERKKEATAEKKETLQDRINKMSDEELKERTARLKLENAYKEQLPREERGKNFLQKSADFLNNLKTAGDAIDGLIKTGKKLAKTFGLSEESDTKNNKDEHPDEYYDDWHNWRTRKPGENLQQYANRLQSLSQLQQSGSKLSKAEQEEAAREAAEARKRAKAAEGGK